MEIASQGRQARYTESDDHFRFRFFPLPAPRPLPLLFTGNEILLVLTLPFLFTGSEILLALTLPLLFTGSEILPALIDDLRKSRGLHSVSAYRHGLYIQVQACGCSAE